MSAATRKTKIQEFEQFVNEFKLGRSEIQGKLNFFWKESAVREKCAQCLQSKKEIEAYDSIIKELVLWNQKIRSAEDEL